MLLAHTQIVDALRSMITLAEKRARTDIMIWCRSGKHRSVSLAVIAKEVLSRSGFEAVHALLSEFRDKSRV